MAHPSLSRLRSRNQESQALQTYVSIVREGADYWQRLHGEYRVSV
jgi:hypothetical protein